MSKSKSERSIAVRAYCDYKHARDYFVCKLYKHERGRFSFDTTPRTQRVGNGHGVLETGTVYTYGDNANI